MVKATAEQIAKLKEILPKISGVSEHERIGLKVHVSQLLKDIDKESAFYLELKDFTSMSLHSILKNAIEYYSSIKD